MNDSLASTPARLCRARLRACITGAVCSLWWVLAATPAQAQTPTLQIGYADAGTSAALVADCVAGGTINGDTRGCSGSTDAVPDHEGSTLTGAGHALFPGHGIDSEAWARASFGTLAAFAQTTTTPQVDVFYTAQSRGDARMADFLVAMNTSGAALTTYQYTVTVHGQLSAPVGCGGIFPCADGSVFVGFDATGLTPCPGCQGAGLNWTAQFAQPTSTVAQGTFTVLAGTTFQMRADLDVGSYVNGFVGQAAAAFADYGSTVTIQLAGVTPGANTIGLSGHDYAAPVPEPATVFQLSAGLLVGAAVRCRRAARRVRGIKA